MKTLDFGLVFNEFALKDQSCLFSSLFKFSITSAIASGATLLLCGCETSCFCNCEALMSHETGYPPSDMDPNDRAPLCEVPDAFPEPSFARFGLRTHSEPLLRTSSDSLRTQDRSLPKTATRQTLRTRTVNLRTGRSFESWNLEQEPWKSDNEFK